MFDRIRHLFDTPESTPTVFDSPKEKTETKEVRVTSKYKEYKVEIQYTDGTTRTERANAYHEKEEVLHLHTWKPYVGHYFKHSERRENIPVRYKPKIEYDKGQPLIISYANVQDIDIMEVEQFVAVAEGVEVEVTYRQYKEGGKWQEKYIDFDTDTEDQYDVTSWFADVWEEKQS